MRRGRPVIYFFLANLTTSRTILDQQQMWVALRTDVRVGHDTVQVLMVTIYKTLSTLRPLLYPMKLIKAVDDLIVRELASSISRTLSQ